LTDSERSKSEMRKPKKLLREPEPMNSHLHTREHRGAILDYKLPDVPEERNVLDTEPTPNS